MGNSTTDSQRRTLSFATLDEFLQDAEAMAESEYKTIGNWSYGQILGHLASAMNNSIDGFGFQASWFLRKIIAPFLKNSALTKPLKPGIKLPKGAEQYLPDPSLTVEDSLAECRKSVERLATETPKARHPFFGAMASEEWMALHLRHAELHMSFVVPGDAPAKNTEPDDTTK